ncbi:Ser/Thr protein kinase RdoA (MazF antagonist) [Plasticicumulans lactativorans]|uniref:Stress response kinase A n=1 Tax=Plasticicumulans lactativorans TaxID=1133106 RepID=A0A4R2KY20_9GAMM|nr:serine/threonine protein kinase [Plasticicumulans lactativorans]TCO78853.1 Ser/Thr protein kinase RdoA (MazF antagonist) [Plasticicumulans lactativorans]
MSAHPYAALGPEQLLAAVEACGYVCDGRFLALSSYENRVYQVGVEDGAPLVAKFYRPGRWSDAAILEEHAFAAELVDAELPVIAPLADAAGCTLHHAGGFAYALYPRRGGRWPPLDDPDTLRRLGRLLARLHRVGATRPFRHRPALDAASFGHASRTWLLAAGVIPEYLRPAYASVSADLLAGVDAAFAAVPVRRIRLHGDCHPGNILWTDDAGAHFVDLDDARSGPAVQDLWLLLSGERAEREAQLGALLDGYEAFARFDTTELALVEPLRALRQLHYAAWLAQRWDDPAFPRAFPWFASPRYWEGHVLELRECLAALDEPPLAAGW